MGNLVSNKRFLVLKITWCVQLRGCSQIISAKNGGVQTPLPPWSAIVSILRTLPLPPPSAADIICKQPLTKGAYSRCSLRLRLRILSYICKLSHKCVIIASFRYTGFMTRSNANGEKSIINLDLSEYHFTYTWRLDKCFIGPIPISI